MPSDRDALNLAKQQNAIVIPFCQGLEGNCEGYVSWWMRCRLQNQPFWRQKYFEQVHNLAAYPAQAEGYYRAADHHDPQTGQIRTDRGLAKARTLQGLFVGTNDDREYIRIGMRDDKVREIRLVAKLFGHEELQPIADHGGIFDSFNYVAWMRMFAKYGLVAMPAHAVALDCSQGASACYFDPNIGEIIFPSGEDFIEWWRVCYENRAQGGGTFGTFQQMFKAEYYVRV